ncbi:MAG: protein-L-isoaspartate(D-aspartate) O-methyltransferase [Fibrella sp.]|nr:protein-L-isoaspartate(D-aspartate) O-methyltransferase [Armatimonadota bacterium]
MIAEQIAARGIRDSRVLNALRRVPRHRFIRSATDAHTRAYADAAQSIGEGQTISQPYIVALMSEALALTGAEKVLEIGAGSGYQTAVLSLLADEVIAVERIPSLAERAGQALGGFGVANVKLFVGDGSRGWEPEAPYDAILVAAVAPAVPPAFVAQLKPGGRLVLPVGQENAPQRLLLLTKASDGSDSVTTHDLGTVAFVPLVGAGGFGLPDDLGMMDI